jgi:hypothetical protein
VIAAGMAALAAVLAVLIPTADVSEDATLSD